MELNEKFVGNVESMKTPDKYNLNHLNTIAEILKCSVKDFVPDKPLPGEIQKRKIRPNEPYSIGTLKKIVLGTLYCID